MSVTPDTSELYPPGPEGVPPQLTQPTRAYKRSAWLAFAGLLAFVALYVGLTVHLGRVVFRLASEAFVGGNPIAFLWALPPLFFFAFLVRGLFVMKQWKDESLVEVKEADEPALFAFVRRIADEAGAPRPHRVFLSARVNAAVFYDLSFLNLLIPTRKNLEIGLGLVNALSIDELKAVIAHEFGHFAQRTMAVGRWVYISQQIAGHIIVTRGAFDRVLAFISGIDLRVAWIGWIMRLLVWAIRAVLDTVFRVIVLAHRALSREMELQADLVSVSLTGSDSLIHALHRLGPADDAWDRAVQFASAELGQKRSLEDLFAAQTRVLDHLRRILDEEDLGQTPVRPEAGREAHRVFEAELAQPPRMWSTHPPNREREENAKRHYLASALDDRSAWSLFLDPEATRREVTQRFLAAFAKEGAPPAPLDESLARLDERFAKPSLDRRYRGAYLGRSIVGSAQRVNELYDPTGDDDRDAVIARLDALYPESLGGDLERWQELGREHAQLVALEEGILTAPGGIIRHRGREIPRRELVHVIERTKHERDAAEEHVLAHDRAVRTAHLQAARLLERGWDDYLEGLLRLLHYADHAAADVRDAHGKMLHVLRIVTADGRVTSGERARLLEACRDAWSAIDAVFAQREDVSLPPAVAKELAHEHFAEVLPGPFELDPPSDQNLANWLGAIDSWAYAAGDATGALANAALEALLEAEDHVARCVREQIDPGDAPARAKVPERYTTLVLGQERERQKRLGWWDRFQLADGFVPGLARFAVASILLVPALLLTGGAGTASVTIYNGLGTSVSVAIDGERVSLAPHTSATIEPDATSHAIVEATSADGRRIERFEVEIDSTWSDYVYDVAGAAPLVEWTAVYGTSREVPDRNLGAPRWLVSHADVLFDEPPVSVSTSRSSGGATRDVLTALASAPPETQLAYVSNLEERQRLIDAHVRWDPTTDPGFLAWMEALPDPVPAIRARLAEAPRDVILLRLEQDAASDRASVCARHLLLAESAPSDVDLAYVATRCLEDREARSRAFLDMHAQHPSHPWVALAAAYEHAAHGAWQDALRAFQQTSVPELAPLRSGLAVEIARVRRVAASDPRTAYLEDLTAESVPLQAMLRADGIGRDDPALDAQLWPWRLFARGQLDAAVDAMRGDADRDAARSGLLRLAAASEGASPELVARAWALAPSEGIDRRTVWATAALALREGRDAAPYLELASTLAGDDAEPLIALVREGRITDPSAVESALGTLVPALRGQALVMGIVALGDAAPAAWRRDVRALLFVPERPYFR